MIYINQITKNQIDSAVKSNSQTVILTGPEGIGLKTVATYFSENSGGEVLEVLPTKQEKPDYQNGTIKINQIRDLYETTRTKSNRGRLIILYKANTMTKEAQNAFLKLLEEPEASTKFVLVCSGTLSLLPTVISRSQTINIRPINLSDSNNLLDDLQVTNNTKRKQLLFMAQGLPGLLYKLATDEQLFSENTKIVMDARRFINASRYERLIIAKEYSDSKSNARLLLEYVSSQLQQSISENGSADALRRLQSTQEALSAINAETNIRLQLSAIS